jgi:hypothetical protein
MLATAAHLWHYSIPEPTITKLDVVMDRSKTRTSDLRLADRGRPVLWADVTMLVPHPMGIYTRHVGHANPIVLKLR